MTPAELHSSSLVGDAHNDLLMGVVGRPPERWAEFFNAQWLPQLRAGNVGLQVLPVFVETKHAAETALRQMLRMVECAHIVAEASSGDVLLCQSADDIEQALNSERIALVLALEGTPGIDHDVELLRTFHRLGVRVASLTHVGRSALGDGSGEDDAGSRLTTSGTAAVEAMVDMGMLLDVSHLGAAGVDHVLQLSSGPLIATHSAARALRNHHRNLSDEHLRGVAASGGIVCVNSYAPFLHLTDHTLDRFLDHIEHIADVIGTHHVGLGPDFVQEVIADTTPPCCEEELAEDSYIPGLEGPAGLPLITGGLLGRGWAPDDVRAVVGENLHRFLVENLR